MVTNPLLPRSPSIPEGGFSVEPQPGLYLSWFLRRTLSPSP